MYSTTGLEANDLVNFYNSNILDEMMLNKNSTSAGKFIGAKGTNVKPQHAMNAHLRKSAQSALANPTTASMIQQSQTNAAANPKMYSGQANGQKVGGHSSGSLDMSGGGAPAYRQ